MNSLKYNLRFTVIVAGNTANKNYTPDQYCNSITIKNIDGTNAATCTVNKNIVLQPGDDVNKIPGESFSFGGNYGELYDAAGRIQLQFSTPAGQALVIEKFYTNYEEICK